jgi:uncharacterized protein DUF6600/FecR-like protein
MTSRRLFPSILAILFSTLVAGVPPAAADSSHARIIRLSLVQGDVRVSRNAHGDSLADSGAQWETAGANLPIRQGYAVATDNGRAEVEFENGAMAFLKENTVLEFYDLSLTDGARMTRLVLRQGSASFYVNPQSGDYFSVTGGDFTVEANGRSSFRLDNYDDGSTVETMKGHVSVLHKDNTTRIDQGQSLSMKAGDDASLSVGRAGEEDDFDRWVAGRVDSVASATSATLQYTSSPYYASGFGALYTYGAWSSCGANGFGWRPFGVGASWSPFTMGQWVWDAGFGWTWMSSQPWGWAPYHYGGWLFDSSCGGWFYSPPMFYGSPGGPRKHFPPRVHAPQPLYRPVTGVFVRNKGHMGIVPMHPLDQKGKTPLNLEHGVFAPTLAKGASEPITGVERGQKWETLKSAPREALSSSLARTTAPPRVSRTVVEGNSAVRAVSLSKDSSIAYDPRERRFVNTNAAASSSSATNAREARSENGPSDVVAVGHAGTPPARTAVPSAPRSATPAPPSRNSAPPPAPRYSGGERSSSGGRSAGPSGSASSGASGAGRSSSSSSSSGSAASSSHPSGGRPH